MSGIAELLRGDSDSINSVLMSSNVGLHQRVLLLQVLDRGQVLAVILRDELSFDFTQPHFQVLDAAVELLLLLSLLQFDALLLGGAHLGLIQ